MESKKLLDAMKTIVIENKTTEISKFGDRVKHWQSLQNLTKDETLAMRKNHVGPSCTLFFKDNPLKMVKGVGQYLYDEEGTQYLDCINNVAHVGHGNEQVLMAVSRQLSLLNTNSRFLHDNLSIYSRRLTSYFPEKLSVCYLVNSGSEANDLAIRLARAHTGNKDIISVDGAYHGNLTSTMAISPYKNHKLPNYKPPKWSHIAPLPCSYRGQYNRDEFTDIEIGDYYAKSVENVINRIRFQGRKAAAFFVESMISCGGQTPLPKGYLRAVSKYLKENNMLLVCDEVQTGFGRTGEKMWAFQLDGDDIIPDIVTLGKPLGNGFPVAAVVTTPDVARSFQDVGSEYFNTFGGNPVSCAAALAVLDEIEDKRLIDNARIVGRYILTSLQQIKNTSNVIGDIRGIGFFIGIDIVQDLITKIPAPEIAHYIVKRFRDEKILMNTEGKYGNVLKFKPPMVFTMDDARRFLKVLKLSLDDFNSDIEPLSSSSSSSSSVSSSSQSRANIDSM